MLRFQSTLPRGSDFIDMFRTGKYNRISIHAPSRERPPFLGVVVITEKISIHAPSRERLSASRKILPCLSISIHAPSRERRRSTAHSKAKQPDFNPRSLAGATGVSGIMFFSHKISIHAPSRERLKKALIKYKEDLFQSTLPRGSDPAAARLGR